MRPELDSEQREAHRTGGADHRCAGTGMVMEKTPRTQPVRGVFSFEGV